MNFKEKIYNLSKKSVFDAVLTISEQNLSDKDINRNVSEFKLLDDSLNIIIFFTIVEENLQENNIHITFELDNSDKINSIRTIEDLIKFVESMIKK
tara:strand:- start:418 stop:705 length:288 start_codon:yes stop_codon:yes gene_type:complete